MVVEIVVWSAEDDRNVYLQERLSGVYTEGVQELFDLVSDDCRVALFDCDGTLWARDSAKEFFYWLIHSGMLSPTIAARAESLAKEFDAGMAEPQICRKMCQIAQGLDADFVLYKAKEFFRTRIAPSIYPPVQKLIAHLAKRGCEIWAVSSSAEWLIGTASEYLCIEQPHMVGSRLRIRQGRFTGRVDRLPTGIAKVRLAQCLIKRAPDIAFGNSIHDRFILEWSRVPVAVNATPNLRLLATARRWKIIYLPEPPY